MSWVQVGGTDIHYVERGDPSRTSIVFLHGFGSCAEAWEHQIEALADRFRVIAYDSVNHGHSSNSPRDGAEPDRADELQGFLDALGLERPILAGNSMGALTILRWATRHPDRAIALAPSGMGIVRQDANSETAERRRRAMFTPVGDEVLFLEGSEGAFSSDFLGTRKCDRYVRLRSTATRIEASRHPRKATMTKPDRDEMADLVATIQSPMQIIVGELDWLADAARELHRVVPGSRLAVIPGAPHNVYYETAEAYQKVLEGFLADVV